MATGRGPAAVPFYDDPLLRPPGALPGRQAPPSDMFLPVADQVDNVRRWNEERGWGLAADDLDAVDTSERQHRNPLVTDVVAVFLEGDDRMDGVRRTCHELWLAAEAEQPDGWCWDQKAWRPPPDFPKPVRLIPGLEHRPGVRRVTLDLAAHWRADRYVRARDFRGPDSAHAEVLAAAAHFPWWVRSMDGVVVPYAWLTGYQVTYPARDMAERLPCLSWSRFRCSVNLTAHWDEYFQCRWAAPQRVDDGTR